jgi:hypothetical protein
MARSDLVQVMVKAVLEVETEVVKREGELVDTKAGWQARHQIGHKLETVVEYKRTIDPPSVSWMSFIADVTLWSSASVF